VLARALELLRQMEEFAQSRYRLEARYHHVLVDEFQDTSRAQWELIEQLVRSWGEGLGASADAIPPSIFIVGDRKQSIYGFRDADVAMLREAASFIHALRPDHSPRRAISVSFRSTPEILAFVNDVFGAIVEADAAATARRDAFRYDETDRFPDTAGTRERESLRSSASDSEVAGGEWGWGPTSSHDDDSSLGIVTGSTVAEAADAVAGEVEHLLRDGVLVRDRTTGERRPARPADVAILFRSRDSHREFEAALDRRGISTYVYKGLGFFDADEIQDAIALLRFLADPESNLRAAALLRSRLVRLSDDGVAKLAPKLADAIAGSEPDTLPRLSAEDRRVLAQLRGAFPGWLAAADLIAAAELLERVLHETAYYLELRGARRLQARENLKKLRSLVRRAQNRGYTTLARIAEHLEQLAVGDESNAAIDAADAVSLMTVHAAKGLEFAVVFLVNLGRGTGGPRAPIRVALAGDGEPAVSVADYQSDADEDAKARDREESKRLLYVALTRARDRLYLSASVVNGDCRMGPGSLGEVLPASLRSVLSAAPGAASAPRATILWTRGGVSAAHRFAAIRRDEREPAAAADGHGCPA
jgi:ATP-dependent helicase/nuclease subunit A